MWFEQALEGYWLERKRGFSPSTVADYSNSFRNFVEFIGEGTDLKDIRPKHVRTFLNYLAEERQHKPHSVANAWTAISSFYTWAEHELGVEHIVRGKIRAPKVPDPEIVPYTQTEVHAMLDACHQTGGRQVQRRPTSLRDRAMITILVDTGVRASELTALKVGDYTRSTGQLLVRKGKGSKPRAVFMGNNARKVLWRYLAERPEADDKAPLIATKTGNHLQRDNVRHTIQRAAERAGVRGATVHRFRHTFAINFLRNGGNPIQLQSMLGHSRMDTLTIYVKLAAVDLEQAQRIASPADNWNL